MTTRPMLYPDEQDQVHRSSSIDQFSDFVATYKKGGWAPLVFDQLDGIVCDEVKTHPVILTFGDIGYVFPEGECEYSSDDFIYFDKEGLEQKVLPECFGGNGEFVEEWVDQNAFVNFDNNASVGTHNEGKLRVGLSMVLADKTLPPVD